jgi:hypothetical protein
MRFGRWKTASAAGAVLSGGLLLVATLVTVGSFAVTPTSARLALTSSASSVGRGDLAITVVPTYSTTFTPPSATRVTPASAGASGAGVAGDRAPAAGPQRRHAPDPRSPRH